LIGQFQKLGPIQKSTLFCFDGIILDRRGAREALSFRSCRILPTVPDCSMNVECRSPSRRVNSKMVLYEERIEACPRFDRAVSETRATPKNQRFSVLMKPRVR
jgi:hypothetical protein